MFKKIIVITIFLFSMVQAMEVGKYAGEFLATGVGAKALGMGGATAAVGGDATFGYWNPAGLTMIKYPEITAMHSRRFGGIVNYDFGAIASPFKKDASIAITAVRLGVDDIPITAIPHAGAVSSTNRPYVDEYVSWAEYAFFLSYAKRYSEKLSYGVNAKFLHKGWEQDSAWGLGFDVGVLWNPVNKLMVGANFQDVTTTLLAWSTGKSELISPTMKVGVAYPVDVSFIGSHLLLAMDIDTRFEGREYASQLNLGPVSFDPRLGCELVVKNAIALRLGRDDLGYFTGGAGLKLPRLDIDYAFLNHDEFDATHRISLRLRIEEERFAR